MRVGHLLPLPLQAELRIYQLELANREKNYNKLFGVNPLVGVLDPMAVSYILKLAGTILMFILF